jgi:hypothetical protein
LLLHGTGVVVAALGAASPVLRASTLQRTRQVLIDGADRGAATLRSSSVRGVEMIAADQLEALGTALVDAISRAAQG